MARSSPTGLVQPSRRQITAALSRLLSAIDRQAVLSGLRRGADHSFEFSAPSAGRLRVSLYVQRSQRRAADRTHTTGAVLVATATETNHKAARVRLTLRLTPAGKRRLRTASQFELQTRASFTPSNGRATAVRRRFKLSR